MSRDDQPAIDRDHQDMVYSELEREQAYIDRAYAALEYMWRRAKNIQDMGFMGAVYADHIIADKELFEIRAQQRVLDLTDSGAPLCFGRIDYRGGDRTYIGRRHVENEEGDILVTDWRAPVATPFYRATVANTMSLSLRRRFILDDRILSDIYDEDLSHPSEQTAAAYVPDPLLAQLGRRRTGEMRDIIATIQAEQDIIIRAPIDRCIIVQGGPGTGKTAVGLHRAAYLLYERRATARSDRFLVVGPNSLFLSYIAQVLPSLGETSAVQKTVSRVGQGAYFISGEDTPEVARIKGDVRMVAVLRQAVRDFCVPPTADVAIKTSRGVATFVARAVAEKIAEVSERGAPWNVARDTLSARLVRLGLSEAGDATNKFAGARLEFEQELTKSREYRAYLTKIWPRLTASSVLKKLYRSPKTLALAAEGILDGSEQGLFLRKVKPQSSDEPWTKADIPLLDEIEALLSGRPEDSYTHIVVDEAQDLSPLELRMIARRSRSGSMTVLGDLAQATGPAAQTNWEEAAEHLEVSGNYEVDDLKVGYRLPAAILEYANRLLPQAAPTVEPSQSVRKAGAAPEVVHASSHARATTALRAAAECLSIWTSAAMLAPPSLMDGLAEALSHDEIEFNDARRVVELNNSLTLATASQAKGLEFDAVVVVEPGGIIQEEGVRALYVALTRAVQKVIIVHSDALPVALSTDPLSADVG